MKEQLKQMELLNFKIETDQRAADSEQKIKDSIAAAPGTKNLYRINIRNISIGYVDVVASTVEEAQEIANHYKQDILYDDPERSGYLELSSWHEVGTDYEILEEDIKLVCGRCGDDVPEGEYCNGYNCCTDGISNDILDGCNQPYLLSYDRYSNGITEDSIDEWERIDIPYLQKDFVAKK